MAGMTAKLAQPRLAFSALFPFRIVRAFPKNFYYFSYYDQIASYRASL